MKERTKTIIHIIATNFYGGPEKQIIEHLVRLNKRVEYQGILISFIENNSRNEILEKAKEMGITNYGIPMKNPFDYKALADIFSLLSKLQADLICAHHYKAVVLGWIAAKKLNIPILNYSRGFTGENIKIQFYEWLERQFVKKVNGIIAVSHGQKIRLNSFRIKKPPFWIVHNCVEIDKTSLEQKSNSKREVLREFDIPKNSLLAVSVGRLSPEKGHKFLIRAVSQLNSKYSNIHYLICGDGVLKEKLIKQAEQLNILNQFRFVGFRKDMDRLYQAIDFLILSSLTEGLPNVVLEAFSYSKPVIATKVGGVPEIVEHQKNGLLINKENPSELARAIEVIAKQELMRKKFGLEGYQKVRNEFTFDTQTKKLITIYDTVLNRLLIQ